jgi:hypothetical protein
MSGDDTSPSSSPNGEVLPPMKDGETPVRQFYADIAAQINNYTDRPDLVLEVIEKHDPGFIKSMNDDAKEFSRKARASRFKFAVFQSYASVCLSIASGLMIAGAAGYALIYETAGFWTLLGAGIFYAITQGGPKVFMKIASQITDWLRKAPKIRGD